MNIFVLLIGFLLFLSMENKNFFHGCHNEGLKYIQTARRQQPAQLAPARLESGKDS